MIDILHMHGFKCAGTTVTWILERNFPGSVAYVESKARGDRLDWRRLSELVNLGSARAVTSHLISPPCEGSGLTKLNLALVRDPRDRLVSAFAYQRRTGSLPQGVLTFREFLARIRNSTLANYQTRHLSPQDVGGWEARNGWQLRPELIDLDRQDFLVGTVERFDETMVLLERRLRGHGVPFDASYPTAKNTTPPVRDAHRNAVPVDMVELDEVLHQRVDLQLTSEFSNPDMQAHLEDFRTRCDDLGSTSPRVRIRPPEDWTYLDVV